MANLKITGENMYLRFVESDDMTTLATGMTGVSLYGGLPTENEQKAEYYMWNKQNQLLFSQRNLTDSDKGHLNCTICLKSDDSIIGYNSTKYLGKELFSHMSAIIPSERRKSYYSELMALRHKFIFDSSGLNATKSTITIPTTASDINTSVRTALDSLYVTNVEALNFHEQGEYRKAEITAAEWTTWINHSDRSTLKNQSYTITTWTGV